MAEIREYKADEAPDLVLLITGFHAVLVCEECGVIWSHAEFVAYSADEEVVPQHQIRHRSGDI